MTDISKLISADLPHSSLFLRGGIGNILFQLSVARMISNKFGGGFEVVTHHTQALNDERTRAAISHICNNFGFNIVRTQYSRHTLELSGLFLQGNKLLLEGSNLSNLVQREKRPRRFAVSGYFQNYGVLKNQIEEVAGLMGLFLDAGNAGWKAQKSEYVGVHIRLGDYKKLNALYGSPSPTYYRRAIHSIQEMEGRKLPIIVVSDDRAEALDFVKSFMRESEFELSQCSASPLEDFLTLARGDYIVAPSSTFSWWASRIGISKLIFLPTPFLLKPWKNKRVDLRSPNTVFLERGVPDDTWR